MYKSLDVSYNDACILSSFDRDDDQNHYIRGSRYNNGEPIYPCTGSSNVFSKGVPGQYYILRGYESLSIRKNHQLVRLGQLDSALERLDLSELPRLNDLGTLPLGVTDLTLRQLPELADLSSLPSSLRRLKIRECPKVVDISSLPPGLRCLDLKNVGVSDLSYLPVDLEELSLAEEGVHDFGQLPAKLRILSLENTSIEDLGCLPSSMISLSLIGENHFRPETMYWNLARLTLDGCGVKNLRNLPNRLVELSVLNCQDLLEIHDLPPHLGSLIVCNCPAVTHFDCTTSNLRSVSLKSMGQSSMPYLPQVLNHLELAFCDWDSLGYLPMSLRTLKIKACDKISSLEALQEHNCLKKLELNRLAGLQKLGSLPPVLESLYLYECSGLTDLGSLPSELKSLRMLWCGGVNRLEPLPSKMERLELLSNGKITVTTPLPDGLEEMRLSKVNFCPRLEVIPRTMTSIDLIEMNVNDLPHRLPTHLKTLSLIGCTGHREAGWIPEGLYELFVTRGVVTELPYMPQLRNLRCENVSLGGIPVSNYDEYVVARSQVAESQS